MHGNRYPNTRRHLVVTLSAHKGGGYDTMSQYIVTLMEPVVYVWDMELVD